MGREITVAGEIIGEKTQLLGQMEYRYPLLLSKQIYLWRAYHYYYYPFPYYRPFHRLLWVCLSSFLFTRKKTCGHARLYR